MTENSLGMSDPSEMVSVVPFHPWRAIRAMPLTVEWRAQPGLLGSWCEVTRTMRLNPTQNQAERRCSAAHEAIHAERGDTACDPSVHREAARRLIEIHDLAEAILFYGEEDIDALAECLWVDRDTYLTRRSNLHPSERGYLLRRLSMKEHTA